MDISWPVSHRRLFFFQYFTWDKTGFVHCRILVISSNKYIQNWYTLQDIQIFDRTFQSTKQIIIDSYSLTIKRKASFSLEAGKYHKEIPYYPRKICKCLEEYVILPRFFQFVLQIIILNTSTSHAKRQNFNRAPSFVSVPWLCTRNQRRI